MHKYSEQALVDQFVAATLSELAENEFRLKSKINTNCKHKNYADIEYISETGIHWVIEAKSNLKDRHNAIHKLFGELLKETGRSRPGNNLHYGVLLPAEGLKFFGKGFAVVNKEKFEAFGDLIPVSKVFYVEGSCIRHLNWAQMHGFQPES